MRKNLLLDMTERQLAWTGLLVLSIGVLLGWAFFSPPQPGTKLFLNSGSLADWMAAAGTWVIGYGAWKYARESHVHSLRQARETRESQLESTISALVLLVLKAGRMSVIQFAYEQFFQLDAAGRKALLENMLQHTINELMSFALSDNEKAKLTTDTVSAFARCETYATNYVFLASDTHHRLLKNTFDLSTNEGNIRIETLRTLALETSEAMDAFKDRLIAESNRLRKLLNESRSNEV